MLVHGVAWDGPWTQDGPPPLGGMPDGGSPALRFRAPSGEPGRVSLAPGASLGFRVLEGLWCLGRSKVHGPQERLHMPCPDAAPAERGKQCGPCFARDDFRLMHDFHRGGSVPAGLRSYLMQPHWLYLATLPAAPRRLARPLQCASGSGSRNRAPCGPATWHMPRTAALCASSKTSSPRNSGRSS